MHRPLNEPGSSRNVRRPRAWIDPRPSPRIAARLVLAVSVGLFAAILASPPAVVLADAGEAVARTPAGVGDGVAGTQPGRAGRPKAARTSGFSLFGNDAGGTRSVGADAWWSAKACAALALAVIGLIAVAARRRGPRSPAAAVEVVGRVSLSPKHAVYLLRVGRRVLVVGAGPQGPPALITELDDVPPDPPAQPPEAGS
jgi:flagellar protein FliO/FliZ